MPNSTGNIFQLENFNYFSVYSYENIFNEVILHIFLTTIQVKPFPHTNILLPREVTEVKSFAAVSLRNV